MENRIELNKVFSYKDAGKIQLIREYGQLIKEEYTEQGIEVQAKVPRSVYNQLQ